MYRYKGATGTIPLNPPFDFAQGKPYQRGTFSDNAKSADCQAL